MERCAVQRGEPLTYTLGADPQFYRCYIKRARVNLLMLSHVCSRNYQISRHGHAPRRETPRGKLVSIGVSRTFPRTVAVRVWISKTC
jgi:hypothetical protein